MLFLVYLLVFVVLAALLFAGTAWFQGYIYSEPAEQLYWRAPAAAGGITLFLAFWGFLAYRSPGDYPAQFQLASQGKAEEFPKLKAIYLDGRTMEVTRAPGQRYFVDAQRQRMPSRPLAVIVKEDSEEVRFEADRDEKGNFAPDPIYGLQYRDSKKRVMNESDLGTLEAPRRWGLLVGNILLNLVHFGVWFVCCWLLLQYQWPHALGVAAVLWLIMTIAVAEMLIRRVEDTKREREKTAVASGSESHCRGDLSLCTDVSLLAAVTPRKASDHDGKPPEHFSPPKFGSSECLFVRGLRHVETGVVEDESRPVTVHFEPVAHLRIDERVQPTTWLQANWAVRIPAPGSAPRSRRTGLGVRRHAIQPPHLLTVQG